MFYRDFQTPRNARVEKTRGSQVFLTVFEVCGYSMKHPFACLIQLLKLIIKYEEKQRNKIAGIYAH